MEFWIYFWVYTLSMIIIWWFFIIAKIHSLKFKNYQPKIVDITNIITIILVVFTILGYILIIFFSKSPNSYDIRDTVKPVNEDSWFSNISKDNIIPETAWEDYY